MSITMDLNEARFTLTDLIKLGTGLVTVVIFAITIQSNLGNLTEKVAEIRDTQVENTKKNEVRWQVTEARINQIESNQRLFEQRLQQLEVKK